MLAEIGRPCCGNKASLCGIWFCYKPEPDPKPGERWTIDDLFIIPRNIEVLHESPHVFVCSPDHLTAIVQALFGDWEQKAEGPFGPVPPIAIGETYYCAPDVVVNTKGELQWPVMNKLRRYGSPLSPLAFATGYSYEQAVAEVWSANKKVFGS